MTTAESLEGMTDAGQFEILATRSLRELDSDCRGVVHVGVNAEGKTICNPIDGFCQVPGSNPPRFVMAGFTLSAPQRLREKWLFDHTHQTAPRGGKKPSAADDGDLIKAAREATALRAAHPGATFVVWLVTNRRLDTELQQTVYAKAAELGVEVRFLEQSGLRDFLDVKPEGQWLRQEHLGIAADQLSASLLRQLSGLSLQQYSNDQLLPPNHELVPTQAADRAAKSLRPTASLYELVGPSGTGKSVVAHGLLHHHVQGGGIGLWIPAAVAVQAPTLAAAVDATIRLLHPRAAPGSGHEAIRIADAANPLMVVLDDINRLPDPVALLRKLIGWSRLGGDSAVSGGPVQTALRIICPVWDANWYPLKHAFESVPWVHVQHVGAMSREEAVACLSASLGTLASEYATSQLADFAKRLHDDPILLGLFGMMLRTAPNGGAVALTENVIGRLVEQAIGELAASDNSLPTDYATALERLVWEMIRRKELYPAWNEVSEWFSGEPALLHNLSKLAAQGHICRVTSTLGVNQLEFRHDRLLDYFVSLAAARALQGETADREAIADPFFTSALGRAIARNELSNAALNWILSNNPVAIVASVPYLATSSSAYADRVVALARTWLMDARNAPASMRWEALWALATANSPRVLSATEGVEGETRLWEARLRNGDAQAGARALSRKFLPAVRASWLEELLEEAKRHHGASLIADLSTLLRSSDLKAPERFGALCLAGYLGDAALGEDVKDAWQIAPNDEHTLMAALWAAFRCARDNPAAILDPMMAAVLALPVDESGKGLGARGALLQELGFAARHGFQDSVIEYLVALGEADEGYRWIVTSLLDDVDHPIAIRYVANTMADADHKAQEAGGWSPWASRWGDRWNQKNSQDEYRLSPQSVAMLRTLWQDPASPLWRRQYAFSRWAKYVEDLDELAEISPDSPHFETAIWQRALRGDRAVAPHVLDRFDGDFHWAHVLPHVWGPEADPRVDAALARLAADGKAQAQPWSNDNFDAAHLLRDIPADAAERLLSKHWAELEKVPMFVQTALYHGTPKCLDLANAALSTRDKEGEWFKHLGSFFGFHTQDLRDRLTLRHLETLQPYLLDFDDGCVGEMVDWCGRFDHRDWALTHLAPEVRRRASEAKQESDGTPPYIVRIARRSFPTDEELLAELDRIESENPRSQRGSLHFWWEHCVERGDPVDRPGKLLVRWLKQRPSNDRLRLAVTVVGDQGRRVDLEDLLAVHSPQDDLDLKLAVANASFAVRRRSLD